MVRRQRIEQALVEGLAPAHLQVEDESHMHSVPKGAESHFKVLVVSEAFQGLGPVDRHRRVNGLLQGELRSGLHALSIRALTPPEWERSGAAGFQSPACLGGSKAG